MKEKTFGIPFAWSRRFSRQKTAAALATENTNNNTASRSTRRTASLFLEKKKKKKASAVYIFDLHIPQKRYDDATLLTTRRQKKPSISFPKREPAAVEVSSQTSSLFGGMFILHCACFLVVYGNRRKCRRKPFSFLFGFFYLFFVPQIRSVRDV